MTYRDKVIQAMSHALGWDASDLFYGVQIKTNSKDPKTMAKIMAYELQSNPYGVREHSYILHCQAIVKRELKEQSE